MIDLLLEGDAMVLIFLQNEVGGGRLDVVDGRQFVEDEGGYFLHRFAVDDDQEVLATGHQIDGVDFVEARDALGDPIEPGAPLGNDLHLDQRVALLLGDLVPIDDGVVSADDFLGF